MITDEEKKSIQVDFKEWNGGFPPGDKHEITVYLDYALNSTFVGREEEVRRFLRDWMEEQ